MSKSLSPVWLLFLVFSIWMSCLIVPAILRVVVVTVVRAVLEATKQ